MQRLVWRGGALRRLWGGVFGNGVGLGSWVWDAFEIESTTSYA
jgi:hypothetical protein